MTLKQAKPLVNPTLQVITLRKDKNMPIDLFGDLKNME